MHRWNAIAIIFVTLSHHASAQDMPLTDILLPGEGWRKVEVKCGKIGGLAADAEGRLYVADKETEKLLRLNGDNKAEVFAKTSDAITCLRAGPNKKLFALSNAQQLFAFDRHGTESVVLDNFPVNDLVVTPTGAIYGAGHTDDVTNGGSIYFVKGMELNTALKNFHFAFDYYLALSPDGATMFVASPTIQVGEMNRIYAFRVGKDGRVEHGQEYCALAARPGIPTAALGLFADRSGRIYAATTLGLQVFDPTGRLCGVITLPQLPLGPLAMAFGGPDFDKLYIASGNQLFVRKLKAKGVPPPK